MDAYMAIFFGGEALTCVGVGLSKKLHPTPNTSPAKKIV
jgi:hypothetical protein